MRLASPGHPFYEELERFAGRVDSGSGVEMLAVLREEARSAEQPGVYFRMLSATLSASIQSAGSAGGVRTHCLCASFLALEWKSERRTTSLSRISESTSAGSSRICIWMGARSSSVERDDSHGKTLGVDATTLEANAALRSIVRRDTGESYESYLKELARKSGIEEPSRADIAKLDKNRPNPNKEWVNPNEPDAELMKMKSGGTDPGAQSRACSS